MASPSTTVRSWRVFIHRTSMLVGVLAAGCLFYSDNPGDKSESDAVQTYSAMKLETAEEDAFSQKLSRGSSGFRYVSDEKGEEADVFSSLPAGDAESGAETSGGDAAALLLSSGNASGNAESDSFFAAMTEAEKESVPPEPPSESVASNSPVTPIPPMETESVSPPASTLAANTLPLVSPPPPTSASPPGNAADKWSSGTSGTPVSSGTPSGSTYPAGSGYSGYSAGSAKTSPVQPPPVPPISTLSASSQEKKPLPPRRFSNFLDVFRFDIDPDWVTSQWENVAGVGPIHTRGYRVPLVTGGDKSDLVGSLTYYFNARLDVEKITFEGYTGDLDKLTAYLKAFQMAKRFTSDPNLLLYESPVMSSGFRSYMKSYYRTTNIDDKFPNRRYWVTMELYPPEA